MRGRGASGQGGQDDRGDEEAVLVNRLAHSSGLLPAHATMRDARWWSTVARVADLDMSTRARRNPYVVRRGTDHHPRGSPESRGAPRRKIPYAKRRRRSLPSDARSANCTAADGSAGNDAYRVRRSRRRQERALQDGSSMTRVIRAATMIASSRLPIMTRERKGEVRLAASS